MECVGPLVSIYSAHSLMMHRLQEVESPARSVALSLVDRSSQETARVAAPTGGSEDATGEATGLQYK